MPNDARARNSSLYAVIAEEKKKKKRKKKVMQKVQQNKAHQLLPMMLARKIVSMKTLYKEHSSKTFGKNFREKVVF